MNLLLFLLACGDFAPRTVVQELRVMAIQSVPAELSPLDQASELNILIADPKQEGAEVMLWSCTNLGDGCLEAQIATDGLEGWVQFFDYETPVTTVPFTIPSSFGIFLQSLPEEQLPFSFTGLWVLACVPNQCDVITEAKNGTLDPSLLSNPSELIRDLPLQSASLAKRSLLISNRSLEERVQNPVITPLFDENPVLPLGEEQELNFQYQLNSTILTNTFLYGYSSAGIIAETGFEDPTVDKEPEGEWTLTWQSGDSRETGDLFIVLENGDGGVDFWTGSATVE